MQINQELKVSSQIPSAKLVQLKEGDIYSALVKERLPQNEAILQIRGQDVKVKFEGEPPKQNQVTVEITNSKQEVPQVKEISLSTIEKTNSLNSTNAIARQLNGGAPVSNETQSAVDFLLSKGIPLNKVTFQQIQTFMDDKNGTLDQKHETLSALVKKGLEPTATHIKAVHQALHEKSFASSIEDVIKGIDPEFRFKSQERTDASLKSEGNSAQSQLQLKAAVQRVAEAINLLETVTVDPKKLGMLKQLKADINSNNIKEVVQKIRESFSFELRRLQNVASKLSDSVKLANMARVATQTQEQVQQSILEPVQKEPTKLIDNNINSNQLIQKAIHVLKKEPKMNEVFQQLSALLDQATSLDEKHQEMLTKSLAKAEELVQSGKELGARQELMQSLTKINNEIPVVSNQNLTTQVDRTEAYQMQEELIASLPIQSKNFIVETVSKKLSQVAIDFKNFKNDISKSLQTVEQLVQQFKSRSTVTAKPMLDTIIQKLDQAILRSDFMLYADMRTEKKMLTASAQLAEAKKLLSKGDYSGATRIVSEVRSVLDKMTFKPSDVRVKHYVSQELGNLENLPASKQVTQNLEMSMNALKQEPMARNAYEYLRHLGLTHEADHAQALVSRDRNQEALPQSLKSFLLKMNDGEGKADGVLNSITGQQLLSKNDPSGLQSLMFTLPLLLQEKLENVKVFVNSKNQNEKIDWENCSLFFLFETKKLGEVGISLTSTDRTLSVKIKNDQQGFQEKMEPLAVLAKERLSDIGYNIGGIKFEPLNKLEKTEAVSLNAQQTQLSKMTEKGYDFSV